MPEAHDAPSLKAENLQEVLSGKYFSDVAVALVPLQSHVEKVAGRFLWHEGRRGEDITAV